MAHLYLRGQTWWADSKVRGRRVRRSLGTRDRLEAEKRARVRDLGGAPRTTWDAFSIYERRSKVRRAPKTHATAISYLRRALEGIGAFRPTEMRTEQVEDYLLARFQDGLAPKTLNHIRSELAAFCGWLEVRGWICENPVKKLRPFPIPAPRIRFLNTDEIVQLDEVLAGTPIRGIVMCMLWAGLRRSEAIWLDRDDLDLDRGLLSVRAKEGWQPKTRRNRTVPISPKLEALLVQGDVGERWLFLSPQGRRWDPDNLSGRFRKRMRSEGLPWTLLDLRHTFATHLIRKPTMSFAKLSALMGNSPEICRRHYAHIATEELVDDISF